MDAQDSDEVLEQEETSRRRCHRQTTSTTNAVLEAQEPPQPPAVVAGLSSTVSVMAVEPAAAWNTERCRFPGPRRRQSSVGSDVGGRVEDDIGRREKVGREMPQTETWRRCVRKVTRSTDRLLSTETESVQMESPRRSIIFLQASVYCLRAFVHRQ